MLNNRRLFAVQNFSYLFILVLLTNDQFFFFFFEGLYFQDFINLSANFFSVGVGQGSAGKQSSEWSFRSVHTIQSSMCRCE